MLPSMFETIHSALLSNASFITATVTLVIVIGYYVFRDYGVPPGPYGLPVIGYWPYLKSDIIHTQLIDLKKKYGDVFSFRVAGQLFINLTTLKNVREAYVTKSDCFQERMNEHNILTRIFQNTVVFSNGEKWQNLRRFFLTQLRDRGMTMYRENTDEAMRETIATLIEELRDNVDKPVDILKFLVSKSNRIIRGTLLGENTTVTEADVVNIITDYRHASKLIHSTNMILLGNIAKYLILPFLPNYFEGLRVHRNATNIFHEIIRDHEKTYDEEHIRDIIDCYIKERNDRKSKGDPTAEYFSNEVLAGNLLQFIGDGVMNSALFVTFFLKALLDHPEEQEKIYQELMEVCGEDRNPSLADKSRLTYTNAFLLEAQRTVNFVPIFPSLKCTRETTLGGYRIPKGAMTLVNFYSIHYDPQVFDNPEKFDPSRYIVKDGKPKAESPIAFGVGKRVCLGEAFVMMEAFLFCTAIVKNFRMSYVKSKDIFELIQSRTLEVVITPRK